MHKIWRACLYARISREDGDKAVSDSIANQQALMENFVESRLSGDIAVSRIEIDDGYSGVNFNRPGFAAMLTAVHMGEIDCIIVKDLSRLGRNWIETGRYVEQIFPILGVRFIAVTDSFDSMEARTANDTILLPFKNLINDVYARDISLKVRSNLDAKRKKGEFVGAFAVYGYVRDSADRNRLAIDNTAAAVVRDIFKRRIAGQSNQGIARMLNESGVASPYEHKKNAGNYYSAFATNQQAAWSAVAVGRILANEVYTGVMEQGKFSSINYKVRERFARAKADWVCVEDTHEAIVSKREFQLAAALLKRDVRVPSGKNELYALSGLLFCGDCGDSMVRRLVPSGGTKYAYYVCGTNKRGEGCKPHSTSERAVESAVLKIVNTLGKIYIGTDFMDFDALSRSLVVWLVERIIVGQDGRIELELSFRK